MKRNDSIHLEEIFALFRNLEGNDKDLEDEAKKSFRESFNTTRDPCIMYGMFDYYLMNGSDRIMDVMVNVRDPHDRFLLDRIADSMRSLKKLPALYLLGHVARIHPTWVYKITTHSVWKELIKIMKTEKDPVVLASSVLVSVILFPMVASNLTQYLQDFFEIFSNLATLKTNNPQKLDKGLLMHFEIVLYILFNRLYGMFPCSFVAYLRHHYSNKENQVVFTQTIKPILDTVRMHPLLITSSKELEATNNRWKKIEANDVIVECSKYVAINTDDKFIDKCPFRNVSPKKIVDRSSLCSPEALAVFAQKLSEDAAIEMGSTGVPSLAQYSSNLTQTDFFDLGAATGATAPMTPQEVHPQTCELSCGENSPPETAIEATPESTPVKRRIERSQSVTGSSVARRIDDFNYPPTSPLKTDPTVCAALQGLPRIQRVLSERSVVNLERSQSVAGSSVIRQITDFSSQPSSPFKINPPVSPSLPGLPRIQKILSERTVNGSSITSNQSNGEADSTIDQLIEVTLSSEETSRGGGVTISLPIINSSTTNTDISKQNNKPVFTESTESQTDLPPVYTFDDFLWSYFRTAHQLTPSQVLEARRTPTFSDYGISALDSYLDEVREQINENLSIPGAVFDNVEIRQLRDQVHLLKCQLQFEKYRREVHAERNRRLFGRYRENHALEEDNNTLREKNETLTRTIVKHTEDSIKNVRHANKNEEAVVSEQNVWIQDNVNLRKELERSKERIKELQEDIEEEKKKYEDFAKGYGALHNEVFELRFIKKQSEEAIEKQCEMRAELSTLHHKMVAADEMEMQLRKWIEKLLMTSTRKPQDEFTIKTLSHTVKVAEKKADDAQGKEEGYKDTILRLERLNATKDRNVEILIQSSQRLEERYKDKLKRSEAFFEELCTRIKEKDDINLTLLAERDRLKHDFQQLTNQPGSYPITPLDVKAFNFEKFRLCHQPKLDKSKPFTDLMSLIEITPESSNANSTSLPSP